ncbi:hypothetical protein EB796_023674 [Bugula neritina]|uniref:Uncharacterized protein n=1 Tax=Bugula neritina TaxID=10212 RepID=A0A7J7IVQ4_BUGNE|nr:hypothetical protein EB796_023674 [Bugula neritina]
MKITNQLIRSKTRQSSLQSIKYLNLSNLEICILEKLGSCCKLQSLNVSHNLIESIPTTIEQCPQLWSFNVSNNKVQSLDGFGRFVAIGTLDLSNNQLSWFELSKLQHLHILDLRLHGNSQLEKDPYYRIHVIDCLPNVWMVDGRLVTTAERIQVKLFFDDSAVSERPVRHKLSASRSFVPSTQKNREVNGIFGDRVIHLMQRFPRQDVFNIDLDVRRLQYLSENMAQDIIVHSSNLSQRCVTN